MSGVVLRDATLEDLPAIQGLIKESFAAMGPYYPELADMFNSYGGDSFKDTDDLHETSFMKTFHGCSFWVCEKDGKVMGCVGLKRHGEDDGELVRMSISAELRGGGIGQIVVKKLTDFCLQRDILRVTAYTANPGAAKFYEKKCGFTVAHTFTHRVKGTDLHVAKLVCHLGERVIRNVAIVGGTHGNECIGVALASQWTANAEEVSRPSFSTRVLLGNPRAVDACRRFVATDLNRQFQTNAESTAGRENAADGEGECVEVLRAAELQTILGRKRRHSDSTGEPSAVRPADFIIDLHSTNSSVGLMCMVSGEGDTLATRLAHHLQGRFPGLKVTFSAGKKPDSWSVDSIATSGVAFGPCAHGVLDSALLEHTRALVAASLSYIEDRNAALLGCVSADQDKASAAVVHGAAITPIPSMTVALDVFTMFAYVPFPANPPNCCVHPDLVGQDFSRIKVGDAAFITTDGTKTGLEFTYPLDPKTKEPVPDDAQKELYVVFVNEASYAERGIAFAVYSMEKKYVC